MLYTTNWIERFNKEVRKTTQHVNSFPNPDAALNDIYGYQTNGGKNLSNTHYKFLPLQTSHGEDLICRSSDTELLTLPYVQSVRLSVAGFNLRITAITTSRTIPGIEVLGIPAHVAITIVLDQPHDFIYGCPSV